MKTKLLKLIRKKFLIKYGLDTERQKVLYIFDIKHNRIVSNKWEDFGSYPDLAFILTQMGLHKLLKKFWNKKALKQFNRI